MKTHKRIAPGLKRRGFALVITVCLMVLLTLLALGMLTLSTIQLRSSSQEIAAGVARDNARLAMMLAIGELQSNAGPDQRITAASDVLADPASPTALAQRGLTGVWKSYKFVPTSPPAAADYSKTGKSGKFLKWLVSSKDTKATGSQDYPKSALATAANSSAQLVSVDKLGYDIRGGLVPVAPDGKKVTGRYAYAVLDEGVKARVNLGRQIVTNTDVGSRSAQMGAGQCPSIERIATLPKLTNDTLNLNSTKPAEGPAFLSKMISLNQAKLAFAQQSATVDTDRLSQDITTVSEGVLANVADGGLKSDINLLAENRPAVITTSTIYKSRYGWSPASDPSWGLATDFANFHRNANLRSDSGVPTMTALAPTNWTAGSSNANAPATISTKAQANAVLIPAIAKVQMVLSLTARDLYLYPKGSPPTDTTNATQLHSPWGNNLKGTKYRYLLHLIYTPIVTLHNPYNVAIEFTSMKVDFVNLPFAMRIQRSGVWQTANLVPVSLMYLSPTAKRFSMTLSNKSASGIPTSTPIRLLPGEVKLFSPYINPNTTWASESQTYANFADWSNDQTTSAGRPSTWNIKGIPGWRDAKVGYDLDWVGGNSFGFTTTVGPNGNSGSCLPLAPDDTVAVEFAPLPDPNQPSRFVVEVTLNPIGSGQTSQPLTSVIDFNYEKVDGLQTSILSGGKLRYPKDGSTVKVVDLFDHSSTPIKDLVNCKSFAIFSAYAKTTHGGNPTDSSGEDGRYASKAWLFNNHTGLVDSQKVLTEHPSHHSHDLNVVALSGNTDTDIQIEPGTDRSHFITGETPVYGRHFGTMFELPLSPIQNLVELNGANLAAGRILPRFTYPVGNSFAHPLLPTSSITTTGLSGDTLVDHSFVLNNVLFDGFYCSGIQSHGTVFGDGLVAKTLASQFLNGNGPNGNSPLSDRRLVRYLPGGTTAATALADVNVTATGHTVVAAYQMLQGAFNVNSTSVSAWKAVLASLRGAGAPSIVLPFAGGGTNESMTSLTDPAAGARFSRFRLPDNSQPTSVSSSTSDTFWHSARDLSDDELTSLATQIVAQVRARGPFLSMGEFVNRQLGPSGENTLTGALQDAIDKTTINNSGWLDGLGAGYDISKGNLSTYKLQTPEALQGSSAAGAPGYLTQADILASLANTPTVRSDTFRIRAYGEAVDPSGNVIARAWCECVVQRVTDYVDAVADKATTSTANLASKIVNPTFGRHFAIRSFRWLKQEEI